MRLVSYVRSPAPVRTAIAVVGLVGAAIATSVLPAQVAPTRDRVAARAQQDFERYRHLRLPTAFGDRVPCEERVGRFCYWQDPGGAVPDEAPGVADARRLLLDSLQAAETRAPGDAWIVGQRVRYLIEAEDWPTALGAAATCAADGWWCAALRGTTLHAVERVDAAAAAFDMALALAPDSVRCHLTDVTPWLDGDERSRFHAMPCPDATGARDSLAAALWRSADPFPGRPTSEARVVFLARRVQAALLAAGARTEDERWGEDMEELGMRFGFATRWALLQSGSSSDPWPSVVGHEPLHAMPFAPHGHAYARFRVAGADTVIDIRPPRAARFRRGDSLLVVVAYDAGPLADSVGADTSARVRASAALVAGGASVARTEGDRRAGTLVIHAPNATGDVFVEAIDSASRRATRGRAGVEALASDAGVSDLLLVKADRVRGRSDVPLDSVLDAIDPRGEIAAGEPFGVYWEAYREPTAQDSLRVELRIVPTTFSLATRLAAALRLRELPTPSSITWASPARTDAGDGHALVVDTAGLPPGRYRIELWLHGRGPDALASAELQIGR